MKKLMDSGSHLVSDGPEVDPARDAFHYAPFARTLASAIAKSPHPEGLTMAIHGAWGSGKTSLLNFVKHELRQLPEAQRPLLIEFNPWWFDDRQMLANQFLTQFAANLPDDWKALKALGNSLAQYSESLGTAAAGLSGIPFLGKAVSGVTKALASKKKSVPALKEEISEALRKNGRRIVFFIDDIDRLSADEILQVFKVVKALANFPNVIYILAYDPQIVTTALSAALGVDGPAYLEKIVQAPFSLPAVDKMDLRGRLFAELDLLLKDHPGPFDTTYWTNVFHEGLDQYITKPRDIVRIVNVLRVTFPGVIGEVNPVDFFALEFLRIFEPNVYAAIKENPERFTDLASDRSRSADHPELKFHNAWLDKVPDPRRAGVQSMMMRIFPRLRTVWTGMGYAHEFIAEWKRQLRVCSSDIIAIYFRFGLPPTKVSIKEMRALLEGAANPAFASEFLRQAANVRRADGTTKVSECIQWLREMKKEISPIAARGLLAALFDIGDSLLSVSDQQDGPFPLPASWRITFLVNDLLTRLEPSELFSVLNANLASANALALAVHVFASAKKYKGTPDGADDATERLSEEEMQQLQETLARRLGEVSDEQFVGSPELESIVLEWSKWDQDACATRVGRVLQSDDYLPKILEGYLRFGYAQQMGDPARVPVPQMDPRELASITDLDQLEPRVVEMLKRTDLNEKQRLAGKRFLKSMALMRDGKDPTGRYAESDE
jgi:predicted KAP-like P-loop ATPase